MINENKENKENKVLESRKKTITPLYIEEDLREWLREYGKGNASKIANEIFRKAKEGIPNIAPALYLNDIEEIKKTIEEQIKEAERIADKEISIYNNRIEQLNYEIQLYQGFIEEIKKKRDIQIANFRKAMQGLEELKQKIIEDNELLKQREKEKIEREEKEEEKRQEREQLLMKKLSLQAGILLKYYDKETGYLNGGNIKWPLKEYVAKRIVSGLMKEFKDLNLQPLEILEKLGDIEVEIEEKGEKIKEKLNNCAWWLNFIEQNSQNLITIED